MRRFLRKRGCETRGALLSSADVREVMFWSSVVWSFRAVRATFVHVGKGADKRAAFLRVLFSPVFAMLFRIFSGIPPAPHLKGFEMILGALCVAWDISSEEELFLLSRLSSYLPQTVGF